MTKDEKRRVYAWSVVASIITSIIVLAIAVLTRHSPLGTGAAGLATVAAVVGGTATLGGIVTALVGLYSLSTVEDKVESKLEDAKEVWRQEMKSELSVLVLALSEYYDGTATSDLRTAAKKMEKALALFPELPLASEHIGMRFADATFAWAWKTINREKPNRPFPMLTFLPSPLIMTPEEDYRTDAIVWLSKARTHTERPETIDLAMSKLFALTGDHDKSLSNLKSAISINNELFPEPSNDIALLLWNITTEREIWQTCDVISHPFMVTLTNDFATEMISQNEPRRCSLLVASKSGTVYFGEPPSSPTVVRIYRIKKSSNGEYGYQIRWYTGQGKPIEHPEQNSEAIDLDAAVSYVNERFFTISRFIE